jgi:hypothetical protein
LPDLCPHQNYDQPMSFHAHSGIMCAVPAILSVSRIFPQPLYLSVCLFLSFFLSSAISLSAQNVVTKVGGDGLEVAAP